MSAIPPLSVQDIRRFVGEQNVLKGQQSVRNGAIVSPVQQGMTLKAYCYGSLPEPCRVQVAFDDTSITTTLCSCSGDTSRDRKRGCEHAAVLLLAWHRQPEAFTQMDDLDTILERQSKAQLFTLVKQFLQKQPEVEWQLTMPPLPGHKHVPIDTNEYRRQVDAAFQHAGREWDAVYGISSDLSTITATAAHFAQQRDYTNTAAIYEVVARETLSSYLSYHDEDGAPGRVVQECVEGLGTCLESERRRKRYGALLLILEADRLSDEEFLRIGRETKSIQEVVTRLLELDRVDEAVQDASQADSWQLVKLADLFVQYGQDTAVERLMYEKAQQERYTLAAEWLKNHHLAKNNLAAALEMAELIFRRRPWFAEYQNIRELALQLGTWEAVRQAVFTFLEATHNTPTLVEVTLDEGESERALHLLEAIKPHGSAGYQWKYDYARMPEIALKAAERAEETYPRAAIDLYQQHIERLITGRGRANYQAACWYLTQIRSLYEKLDETKQWTNYIAWVRKRHSRLSTLKEELTAAGL